MKRFVLILGGARSGKSTFADRLALSLGGEVVYVATAEPGDEEMRRRIEVHRRDRPPQWRTLEAPRHVGRTLSSTAACDVVLVDCLTLLVSNTLGGCWTPEMEESADTSAVTGEVDVELAELLDWYRGFHGALIVVSNEVGLGLVPPYPLGRVYRDVLGHANRRLAEKADEVYFLIAGIPLDLKRLGADIPGG